MGLDFSVLNGYFGILLQGAWWTVALSVLSIAFSFIAGVLMAVSRLSRHAVLRLPVSFVMWLFMGTPLLLQLYLIYFGLDQIGIALTECAGTQEDFHLVADLMPFQTLFDLFEQTTACTMHITDGHVLLATHHAFLIQDAVADIDHLVFGHGFVAHGALHIN